QKIKYIKKKKSHSPTTHYPSATLLGWQKLDFLNETRDNGVWHPSSSLDARKGLWSSEKEPERTLW
ncbi:hypothetical protein ACQP3C_25115, partial [Escherichia coli]